MYAAFNCSLSISNTTFENNIAGMFGGSITSDNCSLNIEYTKFKNNTVLNKVIGEGGGLYLVYNSMIKISHTLLSKCHASSGGAITANSTKIIVSNTSVIANTGSAIHLIDGDSFEIKNSKFVNNSAPDDGGSIVCEACCIVKMVNKRFSQNMAVNRGGAVYIDKKVKTHCL